MKPAGHSWPSAFRILALTALVLVSTCGLGATPTYAGERLFVQSLASQSTSLDPAKSNYVQDDQVMWPIYEALTQLSADGMTMIPALAESWDASEDGLTYTFHLRKNVHFHDGSLLDAETVKVSYERQYLRNSPFYSSTPPNAYEGIMAGLIKDIRILDPYTVRITTQYSRPAQFAIVKIVSLQALKKYGHDLSRNPVGTGPFRLDRVEADQIFLAPFVEGWHGRPKLDGVRFVIPNKDIEGMERLAAGEIDFAFMISPDFFEQLRTNPRIDLIRYGGLNTSVLGMMMRRPALKDRRVREAIVRAVNRERLASVLGRGAMIPAKSVLPPSSGGYDPAVSQAPYDSDRSRALLREAGYSSGLRLRLLYSTHLEIWREMAQAIRSDLEKVGIGLDFVPVSVWKDWHVEWSKGQHDLHLYQWLVSTPDPERFLYGMFYSKSKDNYSQLDNPRIDKLLTDARQPMEEGRRLKIYAEANRLIVEEIPGLFLVHRVGVAGVNTRVKGLTLNLYGLPQDKLATVEVQ